MFSKYKDHWNLTGWHFVLLGLVIFIGVTYYGSRLEGSNLGMFSLALQVGTLTIFIIQLMMTLDNYHQHNVDRSRSFYQKYANLSQMKLNDIDKLFWSNPNLDRLYFEMYNGEPHVDLLHEMKGTVKPTVDILKAEHHACQIIFQTMADIYLVGLEERQNESKSEDLIEWWMTFRKWMRSPLLQCHWRSLRSEHHPRFQQFMQTLLKSNEASLLVR